MKKSRITFTKGGPTGKRYRCCVLDDISDGRFPVKTGNYIVCRNADGTVDISKYIEWKQTWKEVHNNVYLHERKSNENAK